MSKKRFTAEQVIPKLREAEVKLAGGYAPQSAKERATGIPNLKTGIIRGGRSTPGLRVDENRPKNA